MELLESIDNIIKSLYSEKGLTVYCFHNANPRKWNSGNSPWLVGLGFTNCIGTQAVAAFWVCPGTSR